MSLLTRDYNFGKTVTVREKDQHTMAVRNFKKLVKPLMRLMKKKKLRGQKTLAEIQQNKCNASLEDMRNDRATLHAAEDNLANEQLEQRLHHEIQHCGENAAVIVQQGQQQLILPVHAQQIHIPVHFARTSKGTFFWTSMLDVTTTTTAHENHIQLFTKQDRWGQA